MNNKFLKIIIAVFVVLAVIASFPWLDKKIRGDKEEKPKSVSVDFSGFSKESVDKIVIKKGEEEKVLRYDGEKWHIGEEEADSEKVEQLFRDFSLLKVKETVSQSEENQAKFEVSKDTAYQLIIVQNSKESGFFVGKAGPGTSDFYLRREGVKSVYLVNGEMRDKLSWEASKWKRDEGN